MQRVQLAQETLRILREGWYYHAEGERVAIDQAMAAAVAGSRFFGPQSLDTVWAEAQPQRWVPPGVQVRIANETTIQGIRYLFDRQAPKVLALNFASAKHPGGGFLSGAEAQEESLARASGLYACLTPFMEEMYQFHRQQRSPFYSDRMIYSPRVPLFRDQHHLLLSQPYFPSILTAPAVNAAAIRRNAPEQLMSVSPVMCRRIGYVLALARHLGYRYLVLGAWGCGVFGQDPAEVAAHFYYHLYENPALQGAFDRVRFSILDPTPDERIIGPFLARF